METILIPWSQARISLTNAVLHIGQGCVICVTVRLRELVHIVIVFPYEKVICEENYIK